MYEIALREPLLPVVATEIKTPWWRSKRIEVVYVPNEMVVYRVIPHANVAGNTKRLWRSIHKMYDLYASPKSRLEREGLKFSYREKDTLWIDVVFRMVGGERKVEFYVGTSEFQAEKLKRRLENMMHVTVKEASLADVEVPEENTIVQELRYSKHDMFSLNTNTSERQTPIATLLNTVDELTYDGDIARLSICADHEARNKWTKNALWAREKLSKGKVPQRMGVGQFVPMLKSGIASAVNEVHSLLVDIMEALQNTLYKSDKPFKKEQVIDKQTLLVDAINASKISGSTTDKVNLPVFRTHIRVAAHSHDRLTRDTLADTLSTGIADTAEDNELLGVRLRGNAAKKTIGELNNLKLRSNTRLDPNVNLTSTDEIAKLALQLPNRDLQLRYADALDAKYRIEVDVPAPLRQGNGIPLGKASIKDRTIDVDMPVDSPDALYRGYVFIGGQGAGKDTAIKNWIIDGCMTHGIAAVVIDAIDEPGIRGMADGLRDSLPAEKVVDLDLADGEHVIPLDLTEVVTALGRLGASRFADEVIDLIDLSNHTRSRRYLREAAKASGGSLYNIKRIIEDEDFRLTTIERLLAENNERLARELASWGNNDELGGKAAAILDRLDAFFGNDRLHDIFAQAPHKGVDFARWMAEGKVIILRVPNRKLGEVATRTLTHWITLKTFMTRMLMPKDAQANGCFIVFNEPEQYASEGLTKLMGRIGTEGRKERLGSLYAFHHWNKLPKTLQENLLGGGVQQFLFANDHHKTFELSAHRFEDTIPLEQAVRLPQHYAIVSLRAAGVLQPAFIAHMKPPSPARYNNRKLTAQHAKQYGRHWRDI
ncbi:type IV secretory system conjugative DNA transfer family protein [Sporosarcina sp. ITBMC105]